MDEVSSESTEEDDVQQEASQR